MNLSAYDLEQLQMAHRVLTKINAVPIVLGDLRDDLREEIEWRSTKTKTEMVSLIKRSLIVLHKCTTTSDMDEVRLNEAWRAVRTAVEVLRQT